MDQNTIAFMYLKNVSQDKTSIRELIQDVRFEDQLSEVEKIAWKSFKIVTTNFMFNHKAEKCSDVVGDLVQSYKAMGCNMSLKVHFLDSQTSSQKISGWWAMSMDSDFIRAFPPQKSSNKASAFPVCWWIIAWHLEEMFHGQNIAESDPLLLV